MVQVILHQILVYYQFQTIFWGEFKQLGHSVGVFAINTTVGGWYFQSR